MFKTYLFLTYSQKADIFVIRGTDCWGKDGKYTLVLEVTFMNSSMLSQNPALKEQ